MTPTRLQSNLVLVVVLCALVGGVWLSACSQAPGGAEEGRSEGTLSEQGRATLRSLSDFAVEGYEELSIESQKLSLQAARLCDGSDEGSLEETRSAFHRARAAWLGTRTFAMGPEVEYPSRFGPKIDFRPPRYADIAALLEADTPLVPPAETGAHLRGFPAIEYTLFGPWADQLVPEERPCAFLTALTQDLEENTKGLALAWANPDDGFSQALLARGESDTFKSELEALSGLTNRMGYVVENLRDQDLRDPQGDEQGTIRENLVVSLVSDRTSRDFLDTLAGLEQLYFGRADASGLSDYAREQGLDLDDKFSAAFQEAREKIESLPRPFVDALRESAPELAELDAALLELQLLYQLDLAAGLGLLHVFNDADGD